MRHRLFPLAGAPGTCRVMVQHFTRERQRAGAVVRHRRRRGGGGGTHRDRPDRQGGAAPHLLLACSAARALRLSRRAYPGRGTLSRRGGRRRPDLHLGGALVAERQGLRADRITSASPYPIFLPRAERCPKGAIACSVRRTPPLPQSRGSIRQAQTEFSSSSSRAWLRYDPASASYRDRRGVAARRVAERGGGCEAVVVVSTMQE